MQSSQTCSPCGARECRAKGLQGVVTECVRFPASDRKGVRDTAPRTSIRSTRRDYEGSWAMTNSRIVAQQQADKRFVLAKGNARQTPNAAIGCASDAKACARDCSVVWPRIVLK